MLTTGLTLAAFGEPARLAAVEIPDLAGLVRRGVRVVSLHRAADPATPKERGIVGAKVMSNPDRGRHAAGPDRRDPPAGRGGR